MPSVGKFLLQVTLVVSAFSIILLMILLASHPKEGEDSIFIVIRRHIAGWLKQIAEVIDVKEHLPGADGSRHIFTWSNTSRGQVSGSSAGFTWNGSSCAEDNVCNNGKHNCHPMAICNYTNGNYTCKCKDGFTGNGLSCYEANVCNNGKHNCHPMAICNYTNGNYTCKCRDGFTGNGLSCYDQDECDYFSLNKCHRYALCNNTYGSYACNCKSGFIGDGFCCYDAPLVWIQEKIGEVALLPLKERDHRRALSECYRQHYGRLVRLDDKEEVETLLKYMPGGTYAYVDMWYWKDNNVHDDGTPAKLPNMTFSGLGLESCCYHIYRGFSYNLLRCYECSKTYPFHTFCVKPRNREIEPRS